MSSQLYRQSALGRTLQETLDELVMCRHIDSRLASRILSHFDESMASAFSQRVNTRLSFEANKLVSHSHQGNVRTLELRDVTFREGHVIAQVDKLKIIAYDEKNASAVEGSEER